jgi:regulator of RNase E activity RraA
MVTTQNDDISDDILERYKKLGTTTVFSGVRKRGMWMCVMEGIKNFTPGKRIVARARTVRYLPPRPDLDGSSAGEEKPEYQAMETCGPGDVLVVDGLGKANVAIAGDMILLGLQMKNAQGVITDAGIRDMSTVLTYGYGVFAGGATPTTRAPHLGSYAANVDIQCGGVLVRPGDIVVADDDGIVVVPKPMAVEILEWCEEHEELEEQIKEMILRENVSPGKYYNPAMFEKLSKDRHSDIRQG